MWLKAMHINEFVIHSYRGLQDLKLDELNRINILTGDNNCGKTSVLELLSTIDNPGNIGTWVLGTRVQNTRIRDGRLYNGFYNMFPIDEERKVISYQFKDAEGTYNSVEMRADISNVQIAEKEMYRLNGLMRTGSSKSEEIVDAVCMSLEIFINEESVKEYNIYDFQVLMDRFVHRKPRFVRCVYVSPVSYAQENIYLDEVLGDSDFYNELIEILKEFDENITNVSAVRPRGVTSVPDYMILTKNHKKALPLNVYGDGMKKALLLLSAMIKARDGVLLLDEFETAIHTSAMDSLFSWLFKSAMKLNVQIFLTSHSKEAIEKVLKSDEALQPYINLYTLYNYQGKSLVRKMNCLEAIDAQDNLGLELR